MMGNNKSHFLILILQLNCWTPSKKLDDYPHHKLSQGSLLTNVLYERTEGLREGYRPSGQMCLCTGNCQANIKIGWKSVFQPHKSLQPVSAVSLICNLFSRKNWHLAEKSPTHALIKCQSDLHTTLACLSKCLHITIVCVSPKNTATARWSWWHFCSRLKAIFIWCVPWYLSW